MTGLKMFGSLNHFLCDTRVMLKNTHQIHCRKRSDEYRLFLLCCFIINYINYKLFQVSINDKQRPNVSL